MTWYNADGTPCEDQGQDEGQPAFAKSGGQGAGNAITGSFEQTPGEVAATYQAHDPHERANGRTIAEIVQKARAEEQGQQPPETDVEIEPLRKSEDPGVPTVSADELEALKGLVKVAELSKGYEHMASPPGKIDPGDKLMDQMEAKGPPYDATTVMQPEREYLEADEDNGVVAQMAALHEFTQAGYVEYTDTKNAYMRKGLDFKEPEGGLPLGTIKVHKDGKPYKKVGPGKWAVVGTTKKQVVSAKKSPMEVRHAKKVRGTAMRTPPVKKSEEDPIDILTKGMPAEGTVRKEMPGGKASAKNQEEDGGDLEGTKGAGTSATDAGATTVASVTGGSEPSTKVLSDDDVVPGGAMKPHKKALERRVGKSLPLEELMDMMKAAVFSKRDIRPMLQQFKKGLDVTVGVGVPDTREQPMAKSEEQAQQWSQTDGMVLYSDASDLAASAQLEKGYHQEPDNWMKGERTAAMDCQTCGHKTPAMYSNCQSCGVLVKSTQLKADDTVIIG